jgi:hypothetical protein
MAAPRAEKNFPCEKIFLAIDANFSDYILSLARGVAFSKNKETTKNGN